MEVLGDRRLTPTSAPAVQPNVRLNIGTRLAWALRFGKDEKITASVFDWLNGEIVTAREHKNAAKCMFDVRADVGVVRTG